MIYLLLLITTLLLLFLWLFLFPVRFLRGYRVSGEVLEPPDLYVYSFVLHVHTQFSHDSLGKPEDVERALKESKVDFALVTDHENDLVSRFGGRSLVAGKEVKVVSEEGKVLGDLLDFGEVKVVAHPFSEKYGWRLEKDPEYFVELVDLKDELLRSKWRLFLLLLSLPLLYPFLKRKVFRKISRLVDTERLVYRYLKEGWRGKCVGGLDHHVKVYVNEVKRSLLLPDYSVSFSVLRNLLLTDEEVSKGEDLLKALKRGNTVISFTEKVPLVWTEGKFLKVYSPFEKTLTLLVSEKGIESEVLGPNCTLRPRPGRYGVLGFTYIFRIWKFLFGVRPLFIFCPVEVEDERETPSRLGKGEDNGEGEEQKAR